MSYGLQISASGVMSAMYRQDVFAANLSNMDTPGFKPDFPSARMREAVTKEDNVGYLPSNKLLEKLGGGVLLRPNRIDFTQGSLKPSGNALDMAIQGEGFFVVRKADDSTGDSLRLTRDGRFTRDSQGRLATVTDGLPVMDVSNRPIQLTGQGSIQVDGNGLIRQGGIAIGQIQITQIEDKTTLKKIGHSLFEAPSDAMGNRRPATGTLQQNAVEESAADEVKTLMQLTSAAREVDSNVALIQQHDRLMERAIASLGRTNT